MGRLREVADIAHVKISGIVRVLGTRSNREFDLKRMDARNRVSLTDKKMPRSYQLLNNRFWCEANIPNIGSVLSGALRDRDDFNRCLILFCRLPYNLWDADCAQSSSR